jgi:hypothetical protein
VPGTTGAGGNTRGGCGPARNGETIERRDTNRKRSMSFSIKVTVSPTGVERTRPSIDANVDDV